MIYHLDLNIKTILLFKKLKTSRLVVRNVVSTTSILSNILSLFLLKSGPFLLSGSKNHWQILCLDNLLLTLLFDLLI